MPPPMISRTRFAPAARMGPGCARSAACRWRGPLARGLALERGHLAQDGPCLVLHRAAVARRPQPQALLQVVVELADGDAGHAVLRALVLEPNR